MTLKEKEKTSKLKNRAHARASQRCLYESMEELIQTPITKLLKIKYPILLAGMNVAAGPELAAAVTNAGGTFFLLLANCHLSLLIC